MRKDEGKANKNKKVEKEKKKSVSAREGRHDAAKESTK